MSLDRLTGGDGDPDRYSRREDRPFPGAPADREPAPELPKNTLSMDELRAVYERSHSLAELQAEARSYEEAQAAGSSDSPGPASPDSAPAGEGPAEADGEGTAPLGSRPDVQDTRADGFASLDQTEDLPQLPGAPEDREPAPALPGNTPTMDDLRAMHQKASSNAELEAMAPEYAAAQKEASVAGPGREQVLDGQDGFLGRLRDLQVQGGTESGERDLDERTGPGARTSADTLPQPERAEKVSGQKDGDGQSDDGEGQKPKDLVQVQDPAPDAETDRPAEVASEAVPDQQPDAPRLAAMERQMERMMATVEAIQEKLEASEARNGALEAKLAAAEARIGELETREARTEAGRPVDSDQQPRLSGSPDIAKVGDHRDEMGLNDVAGDDEAAQADLAAYDSRIADRSRQEENREPDSPERSEFDEAGQSTLGVAGALGLVNPALALAVSVDTARRKYDELSPDGKYETNSMLETYVMAVGSMPPETAVMALTAAAVLPTLHGRLQGFIDRYRRKD